MASFGQERHTVHVECSHAGAIIQPTILAHDYEQLCGMHLW